MVILIFEDLYLVLERLSLYYWRKWGAERGKRMREIDLFIIIKFKQFALPHFLYLAFSLMKLLAVGLGGSFSFKAISRSIRPRWISMSSFHLLKLVSFRISIVEVWLPTLKVQGVVEKKNIAIKYKQKINKNKSKTFMALF